MQSLPYWGGKNAEKPKLWYNRDIDDLRDVDVKLRPTCSGPIENIEKMPAFEAGNMKKRLPIVQSCTDRSFFSNYPTYRLITFVLKDKIEIPFIVSF